MPELKEFVLSCGFEIKIRKQGTSFGMLRKVMRFLSGVSKERDCPTFMDSKGDTTLWAFDRTGTLYHGYDECIKSINLDADCELSSRVLYGIKVCTDGLI